MTIYFSGLYSQILQFSLFEIQIIVLKFDVNRACFISSGDSLIFQRFFRFAHCADEDQKSETIVCSRKHNENYDKLT